MLAKVVQGCGFNVAANVLAQWLGGGGLRWRAVFHALVWGVLRGLFGVAWYARLAVWVPGRSPRDVLLKVALDQFAYTPFFSVAPRLLTIALLEGRGAAGGARDIRARLWPDLLVGWRIWPLVHAANFFLVPDATQLLTLWSASLFYSTIIELGALRRRAARKRDDESDGGDASTAGPRRSAPAPAPSPGPIRRSSRLAKQRAAA